MDAERLTALLLDLERRGWDALCGSTGGRYYGELMTPDALMVLANGVVMDRVAVAESLEHAPPWRTYDLSDVRLLRIGSDAATLVYVGAAYRDADEPAFTALMCSTYRRLEGDWRLLLYQQTPVPPGD